MRSPPPTPPPLCVADDATFWPWINWTDFATWPDKGSTVVVLPLAGMADWGLGHALDLEETLALAILKDAASRLAPPAPDSAAAGFRLLTLPPLRFVFGVHPGCAFAVDPPAVHRFLDEIVASVAAAGFTRVVLYNASPWNEEVIDAAARDLRIARGLQMFCVNLSGLGFDLHPTRSRTRRAAQTLATWLSGSEPETCDDSFTPPGAAPRATSAWPEEERVSPLPGPAATLDEAAREGPALLEAAGRRLRSLLGEIAARPALADGGALRAMSPACMAAR